jgi:DNA-binding Lrp family transcriptional regulator
MTRSSQIIEGALTKKQEQALNTMITIIDAFYGERENKQMRTWRELEQATGLSTGALSKHLRNLIDQGVIKKVPVHYEYTEEPIKIKGEKRLKMQEVTRFYKSRQDPQDILCQPGFLTKPKARSTKYLAKPPSRFVATGPIQRFSPTETIDEITKGKRKKSQKQG